MEVIVARLRKKDRPGPDRGRPRPRLPALGGSGLMRSLRARLVVVALALVSVALLAGGLAIGVILTRFVRGQIDERLDAQITALRAGVEAGTLAAHPDRFDGRPSTVRAGGSG